MDISAEIAHLMKYGSTEEIRAYFDKKRKLQKQEDFFSFINDLIDNSPFKRAEVAQRAGLSRDYVYKLLRGDKKTTERDYILALCFALKLDILDTQHALELYPFPILDDEDPRSAVIKTGIMTGIDLDTMNEWLEKASFPMIRTSPDMPCAEVGSARSTLFSESVLNSLSERAKEGCISPGTPKPIVQTKTKIAREKDACLHPSPRYNAWYKAFLYRNN